mgnify:CR=1 FL=1
MDEGRYVASISTMYRVLRACDEVRDRRAQATHPTRARPELMADRPNMCWSWDIERHEALSNREEVEDIFRRPVAAGW